MSEYPVVELFTDGACIGNPGPGGWAYILRHPASGKIKEEGGGDPATTNNRMEMMAVISGLKALRCPSKVLLRSDSEYVVIGIVERMERYRALGWRKSRRSKRLIKNVDLWREIYELTAIHSIEAEWVRGHNGHLENERCDELAMDAAQKAAALPQPRPHEPELGSEGLF